MELENLFKEELEELKQDLINHYESSGIKATGDWGASLEVVTTPYSGAIIGNDYTEYIVNGRRPNKNSSPEEIRKWAVGMGSEGGLIYKWAKAKGVNIPPIAIAYSIARDGTKSHKGGTGTDLIDAVLTEVRILQIQGNIGKKLEVDFIERFNKVWA